MGVRFTLDKLSDGNSVVAHDFSYPSRTSGSSSGLSSGLSIPPPDDDESIEESGVLLADESGFCVHAENSNNNDSKTANMPVIVLFIFFSFGFG